MPPSDPAEPWRSFFADFDQMLTEPVRLHCCGGFALVHAYGIARTTIDVDFISVVPHALRQMICDHAGQGSRLHEKHRVYFDPVTVVTPPDGYENRFQPLFAGKWRFLRLFALEAHDLALTKLERNYERDRDDVQRLAAAGHIQKDILVERYRRELRPYLTRETWHDQTVHMWVESYWPSPNQTT
jgi:hypothetical protein